MYVSEELRKNNIAEYLLYMWQVEDIIRANSLDIDRLSAGYLSGFDLSDEKRETLRGWYEQLIQMMREEGVQESGHLQINKNIIIYLSDLHASLLKTDKYPFYTAQYYKVLPYIVELRAKGGKTEQPEVETCFDALYGIMMLHLQKKTVSGQTELAIGEVSKLLSMLADFYKKDKNGELKI